MRPLLPSLALCLVLGCRASSVGSLPETELRVAPTELDFGEVFVGGRALQTVQVTNSSQLTFKVELPLEPPFEAPALLELPGASSVELKVAFRPTQAGAFEGSLAIGTRMVALRGRGLEALDCQPSNVCVTTVFNTAQGQCVETARPDGLACGSRCVMDGSCAHGTCLGKFVSCDDKNACTDDGCTESTGCGHTPRSCPGSGTNPCRVGGCDPVTGCLITDAVDGTSCGPKDCHTNTAKICITGQCVVRPIPGKECLSLAGYLKASNAQANDYFGGHVAVSADGNTVAVSATSEASGATGIDGDQSLNSEPQSGAVYVFHRAGGVWAQEAYVKASNTEATDAFGYSLALSADGNTLAVGAYLESSGGVGVGADQSDNSAHASGAVYVFQRSGAVWAQEAYLKASNTGQGDLFGTSLSLSADGNRLVVGATGEDSGLEGNELDNSADESGAAYVFRRAGGWQQEGYLKAPNAEGGDLFGHSVAISADGWTIAIGALGEDSGAIGVNGSKTDNSAPQSGAVYLFRLSRMGWYSDGYFKASNTGAGDVFGISVALSSDGEALAVGAYGEDSGATGINGNGADNTASQSGAAYLYRHTPTGWKPPTYFKASNTKYPDDFGFSLSLSLDGKSLAVGAWGENSGANGVDGDALDLSAPQSGAVFLFREGATGWALQAYVKASNTGRGDNFSYGLVLSGDGKTLVAGAPAEDSNARGVGGDQTNDAATDSGAIYVYSAP